MRPLLFSQFAVLMGLAGEMLFCSSSPATEIPIFVFAGQSNAVGASTSPAELTGDLSSLLEPQTEVLFYGPYHETLAKTWNPIQPPTEASQAVSGPPGSSGFGPELSAGRELQGKFGGTIAVVKFAINGTDLAYRWNPDFSGSLYEQMTSRVTMAISALRTQKGLKGKVAGFFWMQGEGDTRNLSQANAYQSNLVKFIGRVRNVFGADQLPFVLGQINNAGEYQSIVRATQANIPNEVSNSAFVYTDDLDRSSYPGDLVHFSTKGTVDLGIRFASAYESLHHMVIPGIAGDYNGNSLIEISDYEAWRSNYGEPAKVYGPDSDGNEDGFVDGADYVMWRKRVSNSASESSTLPQAAPEPTAALQGLIGLASLASLRRSVHYVRRRATA